MAPRRSVRSAKIVNNVNYSNKTLNDVLCPICRCILIQPVTLPCNHDFCLSCFDGTLANANLTCPLCRVRFSSWHRIAKKDNKVINLILWDVVQNKFPKQVHNRLEGIEENLEEDAPIKLTTSGEIRKEYELQRHKEEQEIKKAKDAEEKASAELIKRLKEQEEYEETVREEKLKLDEKVARHMANEMGFESKPSVSKVLPKKKRPLEKFSKSSNQYNVTKQSTEKKNIIPQYFSNIINKDKSSKQKKLMQFTIEVTDSNDSIEDECRFFKPIDHRNIPPSKPSTILKVPAKIKKATTFVIGSPTGDTNFSYNSNISAFARFEMTSPILGKPIMELTTSSNQNLFNKRRKLSENGLNVVPKIRKLTLIESDKVYTRCVKNLKSPSKNALHTLKKRPVIRNFSIDKVNNTKLYSKSSPEKSKLCKPNDREQNLGSPFLGFPANEIISQSLKLNGCKTKDNNNDEEICKGKEVQEQNDLELAKKLQEEFNKERYSTRSSITCKTNVKKRRQITLDEIMSTTSKC